MPLEIKVAQADIRGQNNNSVNSAYDELQNWLENDAPGAPIGNPEVVSTNTTASNDMFLAATIVSY
jgi:hypothetical protein